MHSCERLQTHSIGVWHFGQSFVCATSHVAVSLSSVAFFAHRRISSHAAGSCASWRQRKQKAAPQVQCRSRAPRLRHQMALPQSVAGHQRMLGCSSTKDATASADHLVSSASGATRRTKASLIVSPQPASMQPTPSASPLRTASARCARQQSRQNTWPQRSRSSRHSAAATSSIHTLHSTSSTGVAAPPRSSRAPSSPAAASTRAGDELKSSANRS